MHPEIPHVDAILKMVAAHAPAVIFKLISAIAIWLVGRWCIARVVRLFGHVVAQAERFDATLSRYLQSIINFALNFGLVLLILDVLGVNTSSFVALLAGVGLAIGTAWGGLLTHFAAGFFLQVLRPYKVGDVVTIGGITGTVKELGLFSTTLLTGDNVLTIMVNNKVFSDTIKNYSTMPVRRVDCVAKIAHSVDPLDAIARLKAAVALVPNVLLEPAPEVEIIEITAEGPLLCIRPSAPTQCYWQVYHDTYKAIVTTFDDADYLVPAVPTVTRSA